MVFFMGAPPISSLRRPSARCGQEADADPPGVEPGSSAVAPGPRCGWVRRYRLCLVRALSRPCWPCVPAASSARSSPWSSPPLFSSSFHFTFVVSGSEQRPKFPGPARGMPAIVIF